jgi:hypothetical protein
MENRLKKEFATFTQQMSLMKLGFTENCIAQIDSAGSVHLGGAEMKLSSEVIDVIPVATKRQVFEFFRANFKLFHDVKPISGERFKSFILGSNGNTIAYTDNSFESYDEAEDACIEYLFSIAERKAEGFKY